jgi:uncharacterized YccA/Bax inhibitor family protein
MEVSVGTPIAVAVAIGSNVLLYALAGVAVGLVAQRRLVVVAIYSLICVLVASFGLWGAGNGLEFVNAMALLLALVFYAIPFWGVAKASSCFLYRRKPAQPNS